MKIIKIILFPLTILCTTLLIIEFKKNYVIMINDDKKNIFEIYKRKEIEYLL